MEVILLVPTLRPREILCDLGLGERGQGNKATGIDRLEHRRGQLDPNL